MAQYYLISIGLQAYFYNITDIDVNNQEARRKLRGAIRRFWILTMLNTLAPCSPATKLVSEVVLPCQNAKWLGVVLGSDIPVPMSLVVWRRDTGSSGIRFVTNVLAIHSAKRVTATPAAKGKP